MFRPRRTAALTAALAAAALVLAACGSDGSSDDAKGDGKTLKLWHYESADGAMGKAWDEAIKEFQASHPGVKVEFEAKGFEQVQRTASMVLNSDNAPDVMEYNKGNATAGLLSKQGLLTDLSDQVSKHGWDKLLSPSLATTARYDSKGVMGSGKWYGIPNYGEYVVVYYNKDMFAKYGLRVPTTLAEFESVMSTFVSKGVTPLAVGGAEYPAQQILYELALSKADRSWVNAYQLYQGKVDFHGPEFTYAATTFADWVKKGYIAKNSTGIKAEDMAVSWENAKYPILISGTWWFGRFQTEVKFPWATFLFPGNTLHPGSSGNLWVVPAKAKNKQLAYDFIDITMKKQAQNLLGNSGGVPVAADTSAITDPQSRELTENFETIVRNDGLAFYPDWPAPGYYDVLVAAVQNLITGKSSPNAILSQIAKPYEENLANVGG